MPKSQLGGILYIFPPGHIISNLVDYLPDFITGDLFSDYLRQRNAWYLLLSRKISEGGLADHANVQIRPTAKGYLKQVINVKMHLRVCFLHDLMGLLRKFSLQFQVQKRRFDFSLFVKHS